MPNDAPRLLGRPRALRRRPSARYTYSVTLSPRVADQAMLHARRQGLSFSGLVEQLLSDHIGVQSPLVRAPDGIVPGAKLPWKDTVDTTCPVCGATADTGYRYETMYAICKRCGVNTLINWTDREIEVAEASA